MFAKNHIFKFCEFYFKVCFVKLWFHQLAGVDDAEDLVTSPRFLSLGWDFADVVDAITADGSFEFSRTSTFDMLYRPNHRHFPWREAAINHFRSNFLPSELSVSSFSGYLSFLPYFVKILRFAEPIIHLLQLGWDLPRITPEIGFIPGFYTFDSSMIFCYFFTMSEWREIQVNFKRENPDVDGRIYPAQMQKLIFQSLAARAQVARCSKQRWTASD